MKQTKIFGNSNRNKPITFKPYFPEYKRLGVEPLQQQDNRSFKIKGQPLIIDTKVKEKFTPKPMIRNNVPYAEVGHQAPQYNTVVPNVGNNVENVWSSMDNTVIDDLELNDDTSMIDNNDMYPEYAFDDHSTTMPIEPSQSSQDSINLQTNEYLIAIGGQIISTGNLDSIQTEIRQLVFGEHELSEGVSVNVDDIIVLKRVKVKMGVFIDE